MSQFFNPQDLINQFMGAQRQTNKANEKRYGEQTGLLSALINQTGQDFDASMADTANFGASAMNRINTQALQGLASGQQDLNRRGLGNSTIRESVRRGVASDRETQMQQVMEQQAMLRAQQRQAKSSANMQTTGMLAQAIANRNDTGPDMGQYAALLSAFGQGGGGGGGGGSGGGGYGSGYGGSQFAFNSGPWAGTPYLGHRFNLDSQGGLNEQMLIYDPNNPAAPKWGSTF